MHRTTPGATPTPPHLDLARIRAIETRLPLGPSANTGISGVFDPWGRFTKVDATVVAQGRLARIREGLRPRDVIMHRMVGAFDLAQPGQRPVSYPPHYLAWSMLPLGLALIAWVVYIRRRILKRMATDPGSPTSEDAPVSFFAFWHPVIYSAPVPAFFLVLARRYRTLTLPPPASPPSSSWGLIR